MQEVIGSTPIFSTIDNQGFMNFHKAFFITVNTQSTPMAIFGQHTK